MKRALLPCMLLVPLLAAGTARAAERIVVGPLSKNKVPAIDTSLRPVGAHEPGWQDPNAGEGPDGPRRGPQPGPGYYPRTPVGARELPPGYPPVNNDPSDRPVRDWWREGRPLGCWGTFNNYGCNSLAGTLHFIFGSCRQFYGEPCLKGAPPSPLPPWAGPESGYQTDRPLPGENGRESLPLGHHLRRVFGMGGCASCGKY